MEFPETGLTPEGLADTLVAAIEAPEYFKIAYSSAVIDATINGQTAIIGKYIGENLSLAIDLAALEATITLDSGDVITAPLEQDGFSALVESYRQKLSPATGGLTPDTLTQALYLKLQPKERYYGILASAVETATIFGHAPIFGRTEEDQFGLVINETYGTAAVYKGDELVAGYELDMDSFGPLKAVFFDDAE